MSTNIQWEVGESDCCGNGCANCILDSAPQKLTRPSFENKLNILLSYHLYQLLYCEEIKPNILLMHFKCRQETADSNFILHVPAGHHLMMRAPNPKVECSPTKDDTKSFITRPYSPFWSDIEKLEFKILVNLSPNGIMSKYIQQLKPLDLVLFRGPVGSFQHSALYENLLLFCHGVAISPILSIIRDILSDEDDMTKIQLFACFENLETIIFRDEIYDFARYWNFRSKIFLSKPQKGFENYLKYSECVLGRRLGEEEIKKGIQSCKNTKSTKCVICGSKNFQENISAILQGQGVDQNLIDIL